MNFYFYSGQLNEENLFEEISNIDLIQFTASQESAVLQSIFTDSSPSVVDVQTSCSSTQVQKVLTDQTAKTNFGPNMVFNNVKEIHMHYHYKTPNSNLRSHRNVQFWMKLKCEHEHKHVLYMFSE